MTMQEREKRREARPTTMRRGAAALGAALALLALLAPAAPPAPLTGAWAAPLTGAWAAPAAADDHGANLLDNGGFERGDDGWVRCGATVLTDVAVDGADAVVAGRHAVRLRAGEDDAACPPLPGGTGRTRLIGPPVRLPPSNAVTVSLWARATGDGAPALAEAVLIIDEERPWALPDPQRRVVPLIRFALDQPPGWRQYRTVLQGARLDAVRERTVRVAIGVADDDAAPHAQAWLDAVRIVAADERPVAAMPDMRPRPDGPRLLAILVHTPPDAWALVITDDDSPHPWAPAGSLHTTTPPAWSPNGRRLAVADAWDEEQHPAGDHPASRAAVIVVDVLDRTVRRFVADVPGALVGVQWLPDGRRLALAVASSDGRVDLAVASLDDLAAGRPPRMLAAHAAGPSVHHPSGRMLFAAAPGDGAQPGRPAGVWERDLTAPDAADVRVIAHAADTSPAWAPDGRRFVVVRRAHPPGSGADALMLYARDDLAHPRMLLLADHGRAVRHPGWSPDGRTILYTLERDDGDRDIWWLDVESGATGPLIAGGLAAAWEPPPPSGAFRIVLPVILAPPSS